MATNSIRYIYNSNMGMELIFCEHSTISYPTHNHVSVLTIGIVLDGSIVLTANSNVKVYEKNQTFIICPYMPHSISTHSSYTLLSLCIDKNIALDDMSLEEFQAISPVFQKDIYEAISMKTCVDKRMTIGAPGPEAMRKVIELNEKYLKE